MDGASISPRRRVQLTSLVFGLVMLVLLSLRTVPPAHIAVLTTFGKVSNGVLASGLHVCAFSARAPVTVPPCVDLLLTRTRSAAGNPFASTVIFSVKTQLFEQQNHVPTKEGLTVDLDVALLFHVDPLQVHPPPP